MSKQTTKTPLVSAEEACEQAGAILIEMSRQEMRKSGGETFAGMIIIREGKLIILLRSDYCARNRAKVAHQLLALYDAKGKQIRQLKCEDDVRRARKNQGRTSTRKAGA